MNTFENSTKKTFFLKALLIATLLVSLKWVLSYVYFDEDIVLRVIYESQDSAYYPLIKTFADFNFSPTFSDSSSDLKIISFPILSLLINSLFFKFIGGYSFIILEILCTTCFILIFYNIFLKLKFSNIFLINCSIFLFILPTLLIDLTFLDIKTLDLLSVNLQKFYSMRFPRPIISNLFFFLFIFLLIDFYLKKENYVKSFYTLSILMGIMINVYFYLFFIEFFLLIIVFLYKFKKDFFRNILNNFKNILFSLIIFLLFASFFQLQIFFSEPDYIERLGVFYLNSDQKIIMFDYLRNFLFGKNFLFLFLLNTFFFMIIGNKTIKIFYFLFLSSILSPIFFFSFFSKGVDFYHFFDWIVVTGFLFPVISILNIFNLKIFQYLNHYRLKNLMNFFLILMILYFNISNGMKIINKIDKSNLKRNNTNEITNFINRNVFFTNKNLEIFNLNIELSNWFLLNDYKNFSIIPVSFWTPKTNNMLEEEIIASLKFLELNKIDFYKLIKNKRMSWRFKNEFAYIFFGRKYLANSLVTYNNDLSDFNHEEKKYIASNNLLITHQVIIPRSEIRRLLNKFENMNKKINPDIVILDKDGYLKLDTLQNDNFCLIFDNESFVIYMNKAIDTDCRSIKN